MQDYTRLEISVETQGALEDGGQSLARGGVTVELSSGLGGGDTWVVVDSEPSVRGGVYTWSQAQAGRWHWGLGGSEVNKKLAYDLAVYHLQKPLRLLTGWHPYS